MQKDVPTLYEWAGGEAVLQRLFSLFYDKVLKDDLLGPVFRNMSGDHPKHVAHFVAEVFDGPAKYTPPVGTAYL
jgi:hemoglobin